MNRFTHLLLLLAAFFLPFLPLVAEDFGPVSIQMVPSAFPHMASNSASPFCDYEIHNRDTAPAEVRLEVHLYSPVRPSLPQSAVITRVIPSGERLLLTVFFPGADTLDNLARLRTRVFVNQREYPVKSLDTPLSFLACATPMAVDSAVLPWPEIKVSQMLSLGLGKPEMPPLRRSSAKPARRPVSSLWV